MMSDSVKQVPLVAETTIIGGAKRQLRVLLDPLRLASRNLGMAEIAPMLTQANRQTVAGGLTSNSREVIVETGGFLTSAQDAGNGACMRCLPVALATLDAAPEAVRAASRAQARVTHHNPLSDAATECVVGMVQSALRGAGPGELRAAARELVARHPEFDFDGRRMENPSGYVVDTLRAVFQHRHRQKGELRLKL